LIGRKEHLDEKKSDLAIVLHTANRAVNKFTLAANGVSDALDFEHNAAEKIKVVWNIHTFNDILDLKDVTFVSKTGISRRGDFYETQSTRK